MSWLVRARALLPAAALLVGMAHGGGAARADLFERTPTVQVFWLPDEQGRYGFGPVARMELPVRWAIGDAAAVIAPGDWPDGLREALAEALLAAGAAVVELPRGNDRAALRRDLRNALVTLREIEGAGLVVAIGMGEGGDAALAVAADPPGAVHAYAAAVRLGPGQPVFQGGPVDPAEGWAMRGPLFCALLAGVQPAAAPGFAGDCSTGLAVR
ncbi:hypothetical protein [Falsiroseomonas sp. HW251]|uniref:hypothetical protein n=1 Tax=Falsiroseomonas sp. HW251 TaxID=3390998 RepID=UPI003D3114F0